MTIPLELLAPARNAQIGMAAVDHGADAVYIGAPKFSARAAAGNTMEEIAQLIRHAHLYYAKVYVALNTILTDEELPMALALINEIHAIGADGLIIQDVGLLELKLPPIPLIASTQMHNAAAEKVQFLEAVGFKRVILARELSLEEITAIRRETAIELETFVHGALCVSYSGQCYMSQAVAGRSGNRGVCAQPCRSRYTLTDGTGRKVLDRKFLLSLKDLNLSAHIADLAAAGVTSFKIEGRYKEMAYVKNVVAAYRFAIDHFIKDHPCYDRASSGTTRVSFKPDLKRTFNRGYTRYFINGRQETIASLDTQKSVGQYVGTVTAVGKDFFKVDNRTLCNGDGLCFLTPQKNLVGCRVDRVKGERIYPNSLQDLAVGTRLYRNHDHAFDLELKKSSAKRQIDVKMRFMQANTGITLTVTDEDGNQSEHFEPAAFDPARNPERARAQIKNQLMRTGQTPYRVTRVDIHSKFPGFLPLSALNSIRRDTLEKLTCIRQKAFPEPAVSIKPNTTPYPKKHLDYHANILNEAAKRFYKRHGVEQMEPAFENLSHVTGREVMTTRYCIRHQLDACLKDQRRRRVLKEPLTIDDGHHRYRLEFDCRRCQMHLIIE